MKRWISVAIVSMLIGVATYEATAQDTCFEASGTAAAELMACPEGSVSPICLRGMITGGISGEYLAQVPSETRVEGYGLDQLASAVLVVDFNGTFEGQPLQLRVVPFGVADRVPGGGGSFAGLAEVVSGTFNGQPVVSGRFFLSGDAITDNEGTTSKGPFDGQFCVSG